MSPPDRHRSIGVRAFGGLALAIACSPWRPAIADVPTLCRLVPGDASAMVYLEPAESAEGGRSGVALAGMLVDHARAMGLLADVDQSTRLWIDGLAALPLVMGHPAALVLLDIDADPLEDGGHRFRAGRFALLLEVAPDDAAIPARIQHLLSSHTNQQDTTVTHTVAAGRSWYTLTDRRLPEWAIVEWGRIGEAFVITLGRGAMDRVRATHGEPARSLALDGWFASAVHSASPPELHDLWYAQFAALTAPMDVGLRGKVERVLRSLRLDGVDRALWAIGRDGRAVEAASYVRREGRDEKLPISGLRFARDLAPGVIPVEATSYAVIDADPATLLGGICDAYLYARSRRARRSSRAFWRALRASSGVDILQDIVARLKGPIVIHDFPLNAFRIPFFKTIVLTIDGDPAPVRDALDRLLNHVRSRLAETDRPLDVTRDDDGVWYVAFGILGPAVAVTDDRVIISFSPTAVRQNVARLHEAGALDVTDDAQNSTPTPPPPRPSP